MATFKKLELLKVGSVEQSTINVTEKSILISINVSSLFAQELPITIYVRQANGNILSITKDRRILGNSNEEILKSGKILLNIGDQICAITSIDESFDITFSLLGGIK